MRLNDRRNIYIMKNLRTVPASILLLFLFMTGCTREFALTGSETGSGLSVDGKISESSLVYRFKKEDRLRKKRELFNHIYFEGDTVCFSFGFTRPVSEKQVTAYFVDPLTRRSFVAERIDVHDGGRVAGFSLAGTLLEQFLDRELDDPLGKGSLAKRDIPFTVKLLVALPEKTESYEVDGTFRVEYR